MKRVFALLLLCVAAAGLRAAELLPIEQQVMDVVKSPKVTVVHFWAPWCPNCKAELADDGWAKFIAANPEIEFVFVTVRRGDTGDGKDLLAKYNVGPQKNLQLLVHPNGVRRGEGMVQEFMGLPMTWIPTTWVFRDGRLRFALNYGEVRFPMLQQLLTDATPIWSHAPAPAAAAPATAQPATPAPKS